MESLQIIAEFKRDTEKRTYLRQLHERYMRLHTDWALTPKVVRSAENPLGVDVFYMAACRSLVEEELEAIRSHDSSVFPSNEVAAARNNKDASAPAIFVEAYSNIDGNAVEAYTHLDYAWLPDSDQDTTEEVTHSNLFARFERLALPKAPYLSGLPHVPGSIPLSPIERHYSAEETIIYDSPVTAFNGLMAALDVIEQGTPIE